MKYLINLFVVIFLASCSLGPVKDDPQFEYSKANIYKNLEVPPDLTIEKSDNFVIPGISSLGDSVPDYKNAKLFRKGENLWLDMDGDIDLVWSKLHDFLALQGIEIQSSDRLSGLITSSWLKNQTGIASGGLLDNLQSTFQSHNYLDQYIVSVEPVEENKVRVVVLHNSKTKVVLTDKTNGGISEQWVNSASNPALQLTLLKKFMAYSGISSLINNQKFNKTTLNKIFKEKSLHKTVNDHFITVKKAPSFVFNKIKNVSPSLFEIEKIREESDYIVIDHPYMSVRSGQDNLLEEEEEEKNLVRIQVLTIGYDSKIIIRNDRGESIDLATTDKILNKLIEAI